MLAMFLILLLATSVYAGVARPKSSNSGSSVGLAPAWALPETPFSLDADSEEQPIVADSTGTKDDDNNCVCELNIPALLGKARGPFAVKLDTQEVKINRLTARLQRLVDELDERLAAADQESDKLKDLTARLNAHTGDGCPEGQFQCGGHEGCISDVLVCDGSADCKSGIDEQRCNITATAGSSWKGAVTWDQCTQRKPKSIKLAITKITQLDWFPSRPKVEGLLILEKETESSISTDSLHIKGTFDFGGRQVVFAAPEEDGLAFRCQFDGFHTDRCTGNVFRETTGVACAEVILRRVDDEHH